MRLSVVPVLAGIALLTASCGGGSEGEGTDTTRAPALETTAAASTAPASTAPAAPVPPTTALPTTVPPTVAASPTDPATADLIAATDRGTIVALDLETGDSRDLVALNQLAPEAAWVPWHRSLARSSTGDVFVEIQQGSEAGGASQVFRVPAQGGPPAKVADGATPAVSPDGSVLAYSRGDLDGEVVVRDLASGTERVITQLDPGSPDPISALDVSPDGARLAVTWTYEGSSVGLSDIGAATLEEARLVPFDDGCPDAAVWTDAGLVAASVRTYAFACGGEEGEPETGLVVVVDPDGTEVARWELPTAVKAVADLGEGRVAALTDRSELVVLDSGGVRSLGPGFVDVTP